MTPDDLKALLAANDAKGCIACLKNATEAERRAAAKTAAAALKACTAGVPARSASGWLSLSHKQLQAVLPAALAGRSSELRSAQVAVLATATIADLKKFGARGYPPVDDAIAVLSARRPPWVAEWAQMILSSAGPPHFAFQVAIYWRYVHRLVVAGLCAHPHGPVYVSGMIVAICESAVGRSIREALVENADVLDDEIWDIFETELLPGMLSSLSTQSWWGPQTDRWETALVALAGEGRLSRTRLLDASLGGLELDYHEMQARWFAAMHEALRPTLDERGLRAERYLSLAASRNPSTVTFSLNALASLNRAGRVDPGHIIDAVGPALSARTKTTVRSAVELLDRAARRDPAVGARAAVVAVEALAHEAPAIHEAVLELIERHAKPTDSELAGLLRGRVDTVAASQRARLESWLGLKLRTDETRPAAAGIDTLLMRAAALDRPIAERAGVPAAVTALAQNGCDTPAIDFDETAVPRLAPDCVLVPVADLDELIGLLSAILEDPSNADELERVLDGVSRLCDRIPDDFAARTGPLKARAEQQQEKMNWGLWPLAPLMAGLARDWISGKADNVQSAKPKKSLFAIFFSRVLAIARRAAAREAAPLLCAPTHRGGWVDPRVLVERVKAWARSPFDGDMLDAALALLRLAPDAGPRAQALRQAKGLKGPYAAALRYALGGDGETVGADARIWVAAARARAPRADDPLVEARHPDLGPDAGRAARCSLGTGPYTFWDNWIGRALQLITVREPEVPLVDLDNFANAVSSKEPDPRVHDLATVLMHDRQRSPLRNATTWIATVWPLGRDSFFAAAADRLVGFECPPNEARFYQPFLEPLLDPDAPLRPMARLLLAGTLSSNRPELQGLATDAVIVAIDDGRIDGKLLGEAINHLMAEGLMKPARLAKALGDASRVSPLHARVVARALQLAPIGLAPPPKDIHLLLELLKELLVETGEQVSVPAAEDYLRGLKVSGKAGKLARDLLGLKSSSDSSKRFAANSRALMGRIARAERWMRSERWHAV